LVLGWSDDQLRRIVHHLEPVLPEDISVEMRFAVAAVARSIVAEKVLTGLGVHYARAKTPYSQPKRYRTGDPRFSWHYVTKAMDHLRLAGLIEHAVGEYWPGHPGKGLESVALATGQLLCLVGPLIDEWDARAMFGNLETIVLRGRGRCDVDYEETEATVAMRDQVQIVNDALLGLELQHRGRRIVVPPVRRIFSGSFERGGRFYCHGESFQNMSFGQRSELEVMIDGQLHRMVEVDYRNLHIAMAYSEAGEDIPDGDQYRIDGFDRGVVKLAVNTMLNARRGATLAVANALHDDPDLRRVSGVDLRDRVACRALAEQVVAAIERQHQPIKDYFGSNCGARFQRKDSDMAMQVMAAMIHSTGRCPLPIHDSFIVAVADAELLKRTMGEVSTRHGLRLDLKVLRLPGSLSV